MQLLLHPILRGFGREWGGCFGQGMELASGPAGPWGDTSPSPGDLARVPGFIPSVDKRHRGEHVLTNTASLGLPFLVSAVKTNTSKGDEQNIFLLLWESEHCKVQWYARQIVIHVNKWCLMNFFEDSNYSWKTRWQKFLPCRRRQPCWTAILQIPHGICKLKWLGNWSPVHFVGMSHHMHTLSYIAAENQSKELLLSCGLTLHFVKIFFQPICRSLSEFKKHHGKWWKILREGAVNLKYCSKVWPAGLRLSVQKASSSAKCFGRLPSMVAWANKQEGSLSFIHVINFTVLRWKIYWDSLCRFYETFWWAKVYTWKRWFSTFLQKWRRQKV